MANMKNSNIPWIGEIPEHWEVRKLKYLANIKRGASPRPIEDDKYFDEFGERYWVRISDVTSSTKYLEKCEQKLSSLGASLSVPIEEEDFFVSICASVGKPCISKVKACIHDGFVLLQNLDRKLNNYLYFIFDTGLPFIGLGNMGTQLNLNSTIISDIFIPLPSNINKIAVYLDKKTALIEERINIEKEQITKLKEYRKSLISEAVTRGLDKNAKLKDSGIEWIGEIPEGWEVRKLKYLANINNEKVDSSSTNYPFIALENIESSTGKYILTDNNYAGAEGILCNANNIIFGKLRPYLEKIYKVSEISFCSSEFMVFEYQEVPNYIKYTFFSDWFINIVNSSTYGTKMPRANPNYIANLYVPCPSLEEQQKIADYLDTKTSEIDKAISQKEMLIEKIGEYKKSLIYEVVTGKMEV